jgi:hypothetical protein
MPTAEQAVTIDLNPGNQMLTWPTGVRSIRFSMAVSIALGGMLVAFFAWRRSTHVAEPITPFVAPIVALNPEDVNYSPNLETLPQALQEVQENVSAAVDNSNVPLTDRQRETLAIAFAERVRALVAPDVARDVPIFQAQGDPIQHARTYRTNDPLLTWWKGRPFSTSKAYVRVIKPGMRHGWVDMKGYRRTTATPSDGRLDRNKFGRGEFVEVFIPMECKTVKGELIVNLVGYAFAWSEAEQQWMICESVKYADASDRAVVPAVPISF